LLASFPSTWKVKLRVIRPTLKENLMGRKLYVGNLSYDVDSSALQDLFSAHGTVDSAQIITDRDTGRSKGFGFVEMSSDAEAQAAIAALNGQEHGGRALTVNEAKPKENRSGGGGGGGGRGGYGGGGGGGGRGGYGGGGGGGRGGYGGGGGGGRGGY
jgi:RNA recognition motif-containing protein